MINKIKTFAIAILVTGATVTATRAPAAAAADTNTFTNVIQDLSINLTVFSNAPIKSLTSQTGEKPVTVTTKSVITALSNAAAAIPSLVGFDWGKSPQLVIDTKFMATNSPIYTTNAVVTNTALLSNSTVIAFEPTNGFPGTTNVTITGTNGSAMITNNTVGTNGGTNVLTVAGTWTKAGSSVSTTNFSFVGTNGLTNLSGGFPTNVGVWTVITATTNASGTDVTAITYTNFVSGTETNYITNRTGVEVQGGTAAAPTFADVSGYVSESGGSSAIINATGTELGTTNANYTSGSIDSIKSFSVGVFNTTAGTAVGNNLDLSVGGFAKETFNTDVLLKSKTKGTNQVPVTSFTASVAGSGNIGGSYVTNLVGTNEIGLPATEYTGIGSVTNTNFISGGITNPIPVVVEGTISIGAPKSVPQ
jgi:hypothetical protein